MNSGADGHAQKGAAGSGDSGTGRRAEVGTGIGGLTGPFCVPGEVAGHSCHAALRSAPVLLLDATDGVGTTVLELDPLAGIG